MVYIPVIFEQVVQTSSKNITRTNVFRPNNNKKLNNNDNIISNFFQKGFTWIRFLKASVEKKVGSKMKKTNKTE